MIVSKQVADILTAMRVILAFLFPVLGATQGADALPIAVWMLIACWTTDSLDGPLARRSSRQYHTWIGDNDLGVDMTVSVGLLVYMMQSGYVTVLLGTIYILACGLLFLFIGVPRSLGMFVQAPIYGWLIRVALTQAPDPGFWLLIWPLLVMVLTWPRFPKEVIPEWLTGVKNVWGAFVARTKD